jgi:hypothetical protein
MKTYRGVRLTDGTCRVYVEDGKSSVRLQHRSSGISHSPTGFEWGYAGSGPAELARAIVKDITGVEQPESRVYQRFKFKVIATLPTDGWRLTETEIRAVLLLIAGELEGKVDATA